jgi:acyl-CoA dehydrogenase
VDQFSGSGQRHSASDSDDLEDILSTVRDFVRTAVVPVEEQIDAQDGIPDEIVAACKNMELYGFTIPEGVGGLGMNTTEEVQLAILLGWTTPSLRSLFGTNNGIAGHALMEGGTGEQRSHGCLGWPPARSLHRLV